MFKKKAVLGISGVVVLGVGLAGCGSREPRETTAGVPSHPVSAKVVTVAAEAMPVTYEATGTVRARTTGTVSARIMGYVREVKAQIGDRVQEGQLLITLDSREMDTAIRRIEAQGDEIRSAIPEAESGIAAAKANAELAQATFNRMQQLFAKKSISNQEFDEAAARLKAANAAVAMAQAKRNQLDAKLQQVAQEINATQVNRSYTTIAAPFSGIVVSKSVEPGNLAQPGAPLLTIEREGALRLEADVEESRVRAIRPGQSVALTIDGLDRTLSARVSEIVPSVDAASRSVTVKIDLPVVPGLRSGMFGRALFTFGTRQAVVVPSNAIAEQGQLQSVYIVENGVAHKRLVTLGERHADRSEVLSGLSAGESIVSPIPADIADGAKVEVRP